MFIRKLLYIQFLILLLIAPLAYQSLHVVLHHAESDPMDHSLSVYKVYHAEMEDCQVCDFKFTSFNTKDVFIDISLKHTKYKQNISLKDNYLLLFSGLNISLRAPPFQS